MESFFAIMVVMLLLPVIIYFLMRVASNAYFREKLYYQHKLIEDEERGDQK